MSGNPPSPSPLPAYASAMPSSPLIAIGHRRTPAARRESSFGASTIGGGGGGGGGGSGALTPTSLRRSHPALSFGLTRATSGTLPASSSSVYSLTTAAGAGGAGTVPSVLPGATGGPASGGLSLTAPGAVYREAISAVGSPSGAATAAASTAAAAAATAAAAVAPSAGLQPTGALGQGGVAVQLRRRFVSETGAALRSSLPTLF